MVACKKILRWILQHVHYWKYDFLHAVVPTTRWEAEQLTNGYSDFLGGGSSVPCAANRFSLPHAECGCTLCFVILALYGSVLPSSPFLMLQ